MCRLRFFDKKKKRKRKQKTREDKYLALQEVMLLRDAARDGDTVTVRTLLFAAGAQSLMNYTDENGSTPLHIASQEGTHTSAYVAYEALRQHTSAYVAYEARPRKGMRGRDAYVSIRSV